MKCDYCGSDIKARELAAHIAAQHLQQAHDEEIARLRATEAEILRQVPLLAGQGLGALNDNLTQVYRDLQALGEDIDPDSAPDKIRAALESSQNLTPYTMLTCGEWCGNCGAALAGTAPLHEHGMTPRQVIDTPSPYALGSMGAAMVTPIKRSNIQFDITIDGNVITPRATSAAPVARDEIVIQVTGDTARLIVALEDVAQALRDRGLPAITSETVRAMVDKGIPITIDPDVLASMKHGARPDTISDIPSVAPDIAIHGMGAAIVVPQSTSMTNALPRASRMPQHIIPDMAPCGAWCGWCGANKRGDLDSRLFAGMSAEQISKAFGITVDALREIHEKKRSPWEDIF